MGGRVAGKTAIITGGASGIGRATSRLLAEEGANVVVADVQDEAGEATAKAIRDAGGSALFQRLDVRSEESWAAATQRALGEFGKLNILLNGAGVATPFGSAETQTFEAWRSIMAVNSDGVFLGVQAAIRAMRASGERGSIINISSIAGIVGLAGNPAYVASKGAVRLLTKSAALYCAREKLPIRVNSVHPGYIFTEMAISTMRQASDIETRRREVEAMIPVGRMGEADDIAAGILFLASEESRYMTGAELVIDGGYTAA
jgi:3(or 17)beta-hydroxysteroid dehydrogenase